MSWNASAVTAVEHTAYSSVSPITLSSLAARFFSVVTCFCSDLTCAASDFSVGPLAAPRAGRRRDEQHDGRGRRDCQYLPHDVPPRSASSGSLQYATG